LPDGPLDPASGEQADQIAVEEVPGARVVLEGRVPVRQAQATDTLVGMVGRRELVDGEDLRGQALEDRRRHHAADSVRVSRARSRSASVRTPTGYGPRAKGSEAIGRELDATGLGGSRQWSPGRILAAQPAGAKGVPWQLGRKLARVRRAGPRTPPTSRPRHAGGACYGRSTLASGSNPRRSLGLAYSRAPCRAAATAAEKRPQTSATRPRPPRPIQSPTT